MAQKIQIIVGSTRPGRIGDRIAHWVHNIAVQNGYVDFELVDLAEWKLPLLDEPIPAKAGVYQNEHSIRWSEKIQEADGYIIVTPEYNHGYPAALKNALDYLFHEWREKPVAIISYGIQRGGVIAARQLDEVVRELGMHPLETQVAIQVDRSMLFGGSLAEGLVRYESNVQTIIKELATRLAVRETV